MKLISHVKNRTFSKILFHGCSITWGDELEDRENERYSKLICNNFGIDENNIALCGNSNDRIVREAIEYLEKEKVDIVVLQFTVHSRMEWFDRQGFLHRFTPQLTSTHGKVKLKGNPMSDELRERLHSAGKWFYRFVYSDIFGAENMWKNMVLFDSYCKANDITFIPLLADHFHEVIRRPEKFYHEKVGHTGWWKPLYQGFPITRLHEHIIGHKEDGIGNHVYGDYFANGNHPNASGHQKIAEKVIELIEAI